MLAHAFRLLTSGAPHKNNKKRFKSTSHHRLIAKPPLTLASKSTTLTNVNDAASAVGGSPMIPLLECASPMQRLILEESIWWVQYRARITCAATSSGTAASKLRLHDTRHTTRRQEWEKRTTSHQCLATHPPFSGKHEEGTPTTQQTESGRSNPNPTLLDVACHPRQRKILEISLGNTRGGGAGWLAGWLAGRKTPASLMWKHSYGGNARTEHVASSGLARACGLEMSRARNNVAFFRNSRLAKVFLPRPPIAPDRPSGNTTIASVDSSET